MSQSDAELLDQVYIAAPCSADWDSMQGDDRKRLCGQCSLNVYNIASMSTKEAATLIRETEGRLCLRLYRRKDGSVITDNCPVGLRKLRDLLKLRILAVVTFLACTGLISEAHAQGIIGAPASPLGYAGSQMVPVDPMKPINQAYTMFGCCSAAAFWIAANKRSSIALIGFGLALIMFLTGVFCGAWNIYGTGQSAP